MQLKTQRSAVLTSKKIFRSTFIPLLLGGIIYYFSRPNSIYFLNWTNKILNFEPPKFNFPNWITYNLPDGLWVFALTNLLLIIWNYKINRQTISWISIPLILGVGLEFSYGTFDLLDLTFIIVGATIPILFNLKNSKFTLTKTIIYANKN